MSKSTVTPERDTVSSLGMWIYLMTDCLLFASLFATYAVLHGRTAGGVSSQDIVNMPLIMVSTIALLTSSLTSGLALLHLRQGITRRAKQYLGATLLLGAVFLGLEIYEFATLVGEGHSWQSSAFLSAFFTLVGTHGLHILVGLIWGSVLLWALTVRQHRTELTQKMTLFVMFWHFLDVVWVCLFTFVYAMGSMAP